MSDDSKIERSSVKRRPPNAGMGRKRGSKNRIPASVKEMLLQSLRNIGGVEYLERQAVENPAAFMALLGKLIPSELRADVDIEATAYSGGIVAIPQPFKTVEEWRAAFNLDAKPEKIEGGSDDR